MNTEPNPMLAEYVKLCGTRATIDDAKTLPARFKAVLNWQGDLAAFVIKFPQALSTGVNLLVESENKERAEAEKLRIRMVLAAYGVRRDE